jgi:hypothetical protein
MVRENPNPGEIQEGQQAGKEVITINFDNREILRICALCLAVSVLGSLCAMWLAKNWK